jgi:hypothetical protein
LWSVPLFFSDHNVAWFCHMSLTSGELSLYFNWAPRDEGVLGEWGIAPPILDLGTRWRWVVSFTPRPLYPQGKSPCHPLDRKLGGSQSRSGHSDEKKNSQPLPGLKPPIIQPVAQRYATEPFWLLHIGFSYVKVTEHDSVKECGNPFP